MDTVKQPKWDKQEGAPIIITNPEGLNSTPPLNEPLKVGQEATGTIGGVEVIVRLKEIVNGTRAHGEVVAIMDGMVDRNSLGDIFLGDTVFIRREDMYSLDIDTVRNEA